MVYNECLNYLNLAIKYNSKYERISKFIRFHGIEINEGKFILEDNISENKIKNLLDGFTNISIENFDEGSFPRKLSLVINKKK